MFQAIKDAAAAWSRHDAPRLGAALAYYAVLSLAPALIVAAAICGIAFGHDAAQGKIYVEMQAFVGSQIAEIVQGLLKSAAQPTAGTVATVLGFATMIVGASGVFLELRATMNYIWDAPPQAEQGFVAVLRDRFLSFAMVIGAGALLMASLAVTVILQSADAYSGHFFKLPPTLLETFNFLVTLTLTSVLFALMYRVIPEVRVDWEDVAIGSVITALLFSGGKHLLGLYLGRAAIGSAYGAAGSLVVLLVWVYYSAQIFLFGAEFTYVWAARRRPVQRNT